MVLCVLVFFLSQQPHSPPAVILRRESGQLLQETQIQMNESVWCLYRDMLAVYTGLCQHITPTPGMIQGWAESRNMPLVGRNPTHLEFAFPLLSWSSAVRHAKTPPTYLFLFLFLLTTSAFCPPVSCFLWLSFFPPYLRLTADTERVRINWQIHLIAHVYQCMNFKENM